MQIGLDTSALDVHFRAHAHRGTGRYVAQLWKHLAELSSPQITVEAVQPQGAQSWYAPEQLVEKLLPFGRTTVNRQLIFPLRLLCHPLRSFDLIHFPAHIDAPSWSASRTAVTVLDLIPLVLSELYAPKVNSWRFRLGRSLELQAIRNAELVFAISEHTARDIHQILGVPEDQIVVTHLGVDQMFTPSPGSSPEFCLSQFSVPRGEPTVLYVGGIDQRKNMSCLIKAFEELCDRFAESERGSRPQLLIVGKIQDDEQYPHLKQLMEASKFSERIFEAGFVEDGKLVELMRACSIFLFPTLYEGFGLPPLEAMATGLPVVSSDRSCLPEILGDAALFFDPDDASQAAKWMEELLLNEELYQRQIKRGLRQASLFSWRKTAERTLIGYERLVSQQRIRQPKYLNGKQARGPLELKE